MAKNSNSADKQEPQEVQVLSVHPNLHLTLVTRKQDVVKVGDRFEKIETRKHKRLDFKRHMAKIPADEADSLRKMERYGREYILLDDLRSKIKTDKKAFRSFWKDLSTRYKCHMGIEFSEKGWEKFKEKLFDKMGLNDLESATME